MGSFIENIVYTLNKITFQKDRIDYLRRVLLFAKMSSDERNLLKKKLASEFGLKELPKGNSYSFKNERERETKMDDMRTEQTGDVWEVEIECVSECSKAPKEVTVLIDPLFIMKTDVLMNKYRNREWLGYLVGLKDKPFHVLDLVIPVQNATHSSVSNITFPNGKTIIGVIHSHHNMNIGFSGTDDEWINQNHNISILVNHKDMKARVRYPLACGAKKIMDAKLKIHYNVEFNEAEFIKEAEEKIQEPDHRTSYTVISNRNYEGNENLYSKSENEKELSLEEELKLEFLRKNPQQLLM